MREITKEMISKMGFVQMYLQSLMQRLDPTINAVMYTYDDGAGEEYVVVCRNGKNQRICVTGDSLAAMTMDVIREAVQQ